VFNPTPSNVYTPFTYVVEPSTAGMHQHGRADDATEAGQGYHARPVAASSVAPDSADEASDVTARGRESHPREEDAQPHVREHARWNAVEGAWQRRRGRGYGKMRTVVPRRLGGELAARPFFKRLVGEHGAGSVEKGEHGGLGMVV
jgi:hypothetical protein